MAINDGVMDDLTEGGVVDNDVVLPPGQKPTTTGSAVINVNDNPAKTPSTILTPEAEEKLLNSDITFKLVKDGQTRLVALKDIEADIIGQESVSQKTALFVDNAFGNYITESMPINLFTEHPTKVNFMNVKTFMMNRIAQEEEIVVSNFGILLSNTDDIEAIVNKIPASLEVLRSLLFSVRFDNVDFFEEIRTNKNVVISYHEAFINILRHPIVQMDLADVSIANVDTGAIARYLNAIVKVSMVYLPNLNKEAITIQSLLNFYEQDLWTLYFEDLQKEFEEKRDDLKKINDEFAKHDAKSIELFIAEKSGEVAEANNFIFKKMKMVNDLILLTVPVKALFDCLKKF